MQARKLQPPAPLSEGDRKLYAAAPAPRNVEVPSGEYVERYYGGDETLMADRHAAPRISKSFTDTDASRRQTARIRGGVAWKDFTQTDHEAGLSADMRYKSRVIETKTRFAPLSAEERLSFRQTNLDGDTVSQTVQDDINVVALRALAEGRANEAEVLRHENELRAAQLGIAL